LWASVLKQTTPVVFFWQGRMTDVVGDPKKLSSYKPSVAQKMYLTDTMKYMTAIAGFVAGMAAYLNNDDDEDTGVSFDPSSSDFMKIRLGKNLVIDPWGGRQQEWVFQGRIITNSITNSKGEKKRLGQGDAPTYLELVGNRLKNKLAPTPGMMVKAASLKPRKNWDTGTYELYDQYGEPYSLTSEVENIYPMYWSTLQEINEEEPALVKAFLVAYGMLGGGISMSPNEAMKNTGKLSEQSKRILDENEASVYPRKVAYKDKEMTPEQFEQYRDAYLDYITNQLNEDSEHYAALTHEQFNIDFAILKKQAKERAISSITK
jgi:hypothetical protein